MSEVNPRDVEENARDEDPGANTAMFQKFVDDGAAAPASSRARLLAFALAGVVFVALVVVAVLALS